MMSVGSVAVFNYYFDPRNSKSKPTDFKYAASLCHVQKKSLGFVISSKFSFLYAVIFSEIFLAFSNCPFFNALALFSRN